MSKMTITSSGPKCDVCGEYIFGLTPDDLMYPFSCTGIKQELHSCKDCKKIIEEIGSDWAKLPEGPLKKVFTNNPDKKQEVGKNG